MLTNVLFFIGKLLLILLGLVVLVVFIYALILIIIFVYKSIKKEIRKWDVEMKYIVYVKEETDSDFDSCLEFSFDTYDKARHFIESFLFITNYTIILKRVDK